ncbi:hypothetical protein S40293_00031 [Stachybotrys chartarum IBT 40293]|nr:hypothetical protein S40293_00031 [Stachybotrys chartarum IBT 40293]
MASLSLILAAASVAQAYTNIDCGFYMRKNIDPIVMPGEYRSHMHSFFGSDAVTASTNTSEQLRQGCHTNSNPNDFSVYCKHAGAPWRTSTDLSGIPTLYAVVNDERVPVEPNAFKAYYEKSGEAEIPYPEDLMIVAGNAQATSPADVDPLATHSWWCEYGFEDGVDPTNPDPSGFPAKTCSLGRLQTILRFQDCVNPDTLEVAYSGRHNLPRVNRCPEGMKRIPQLRFSVRYNLSKALPDGWNGPAPLELASGAGYTFHGDFMNGWDPEASANMLTQITDKREFQALTGSITSLPNCEARDADPDNGTSDLQESISLIDAASAPVPEPENVPEVVPEADEASASPTPIQATVTVYVTVAPTECAPTQGSSY